jgi:hypothetical protein
VVVKLFALECDEKACCLSYQKFILPRKKRREKFVLWAGKNLIRFLKKRKLLQCDNNQGKQNTQMCTCMIFNNKKSLEVKTRKEAHVQNPSAKIFYGSVG